jgi:formylglycine-generating enzyme required for sulfatase activity
VNGRIPGHGDDPPPALITTRVGQIQLRLIPAGEFWAGAEDSDPLAYDDEKPRREERIGEGFYLSVSPITQAQFQAVMGRNPSHLRNVPDHPVENVTWHEAARFCSRLSWKEGLQPYYKMRGTKRVSIFGGDGFRLPTAVEWEYACRAGTQTRYCFGDDTGRLAEYAWYAANSGGTTRPVARKQPNAWGLYDMHGNVWEWCWDPCGEDPSRLETTDEHPPDLEPLYRTVRGGSWGNKAGDLRASLRLKEMPSRRSANLGFRIARGLSGTAKGIG